MGKIISRTGFAVALISLFISFNGIASFVAVIISIIGLIKTTSQDKKSSRYAFAGIAVGLVGMVYSFILMVFMHK